MFSMPGSNREGGFRGKHFITHVLYAWFMGNTYLGKHTHVKHTRCVCFPTDTSRLVSHYDNMLLISRCMLGRKMP